ncbi:hypothetical protein CEUSTIGMA_g12942.t1 [Chlamydomonas eustigma]|uniref:TIP41-like protein n=1 Tax=Chlamydomonas eustigma TaxID=1157962 RepID=A0A250XR58_9CHLO|nr:hypothetical protein CEUSTIGMA_g12942.t1 [Chlamydomonas eustigma]|eukprot:GAX85526.1 hypothetical protein CEUSTIGMA_g12942.t1 [Chlamydomonas eustigma]
MSSSNTAKSLNSDGISIHGWRISTVKGPIIADRDSDEFRIQLGRDGVFSLPEMLFNQNRVTLLHEDSGVSIDLNAQDALRDWRQADTGQPLQVTVAKAWQSSRHDEIQQQKAVQLDYDWTYTTAISERTMSPVTSSHDPDRSNKATEGSQNSYESLHDVPQRVVPNWEDCTEQIDRSMLLERDPILFFDEVILYESDLDDNGVCLMTAKLRVMPKCWFVLLRLWIRVDGCMVRLRETRLFCRHDLPHTKRTVIKEVKCSEGTFQELRAAGAPDDGPAYADADSASSVFQAVAPIGLKLFKLEKLQVPT